MYLAKQSDVSVAIRAVSNAVAALPKRQEKPGKKQGDPFPGLKGQDDATRALDCFLNRRSEKARFGNYFVKGDRLYFARVMQGVLERAEIATRTASGLPIGNASALPLLTDRMSFGRRHTPWQQNRATPVQRLMGERIMMLPFNVFAESKLDLKSVEMVESGPAEEITEKVTRYVRGKNKTEMVDRHFTGARLFRLGKSYFLFDMDRRELEHGVLNPFLVELSGQASSIRSAYEGLKPAEVTRAESAGIKVKRQGEWFFIKVDDKTAKAEIGDQKPEGIELRAGDNTPNDANGVEIENEKGEKTHLVTGKVQHRGREHADLVLPGYWRAIPNTSVRSFTIRGRID